MTLGTGLMRWAIVTLGVVTAGTLAGIVALAALGHSVPQQLLDAFGQEIIALFGGQLFLGHQQVVQGQTAATSATIQGLTAQLGGAVNVAAGAPPATQAPTVVPVNPDIPTSPSPAPTSATGSTGSGTTLGGSL